MFNLAAFLIYIFINAYTPGPNNILSMSNAARVGLRKAFPFNLGIFCGLLTMMMLCALFSAALFALTPKVALPMKILGAIYMLYLAIKIFRSAALTTEEGKSESFISGLLLQFVNVKIMLYGLTAMSVHIVPYYNSPPWLAAFALGLALTCFSANLCWAVFGSVFFRIFARHRKVINAIMALLLVYCAVSLFL